MQSASLKNGQKGSNLIKRQGEAGQVLLLVVLASVIALTVGLAAVSRSITSTRISTEESNSQKALSAAEAGIEEQINKALSGNAEAIPLSKDFNNNSGFISQAKADTPRQGQAFELNNGDLILQDEGADIWLSDQDFKDTSRTSTELTIYWHGGACEDNPAAIEVAVVYGDRINPSMTRYAYDQCKDHATRLNNFTAPDTSNDQLPEFETNYNRSFTIDILNGYIARVIPLYASTNIAVVSADEDLPVQGYIIESTGESGETVRKLQVYQGLPKLPIEFFPYNLFLP